MKALRINTLIVITLFICSVSHAMDYKLNCFGEVCGGTPPYSSCGEGRLTVHLDDKLIEGYVGDNSFYGNLIRLNVKKETGKAVAFSEEGIVHFKTFPTPKVRIEGFGFHKPIVLQCRVFKFDP
jgi:hypothetical protein